jgi:hypothetical protein
MEGRKILRLGLFRRSLCFRYVWHLAVTDVFKNRGKGTITTMFKNALLYIILRHISAFIKTNVRHL